MTNPKDPNAGDVQGDSRFPNALYCVTGTRPVDPPGRSRVRDVQQYELRVSNGWISFDEKLKELYEQ